MILFITISILQVHAVYASEDLLAAIKSHRITLESDVAVQRNTIAPTLAFGFINSSPVMLTSKPSKRPTSFNRFQSKQPSNPSTLYPTLGKPGDGSHSGSLKPVHPNHPIIAPTLQPTKVSDVKTQPTSFVSGQQTQLSSNSTVSAVEFVVLLQDFVVTMNSDQYTSTFTNVLYRRLQYGFKGSFESYLSLYLNLSVANETRRQLLSQLTYSGEAKFGKVVSINEVYTIQQQILLDTKAFQETSPNVVNITISPLSLQVQDPSPLKSSKTEHSVSGSTPTVLLAVGLGLVALLIALSLYIIYKNRGPRSIQRDDSVKESPAITAPSVFDKSIADDESRAIDSVVRRLPYDESECYSVSDFTITCSQVGDDASENGMFKVEMEGGEKFSEPSGTIEGCLESTNQYLEKRRIEKAQQIEKSLLALSDLDDCYDSDANYTFDFVGSNDLHSDDEDIYISDHEQAVKAFRIL
jgi:hypothetical protein